MPDATEQELKAMCENLVKLRGDIDSTTLQERTVKIEKDFAKRAERIESSKKKELEAWDQELEAKIKEMTSEEGDKEKASEEDIKKEKENYAAKKADVEKRYAEQTKRFDPDKAAALKEAKEKVAKSEADFAEDTKECLAEAKKEGVTQKVAQCRASATSTDQYWNKCR